MEQFLGSLWQRWQMRGARPDGRRLCADAGCVLTLCFRAKLGAWLIFLLFFGLLGGVLITQAVAPQPRRVFLLEAVGFSVFSAMAGYYLIFAYWYRVYLDERGLVLCRFLIPTRRIFWEDVVEFKYQPGDELLKLCARNGQKVCLYLTLNGLSVVRERLASFTPRSATISSWTTSDPALIEHVPSWGSGEMERGDSPFDRLMK